MKTNPCKFNNTLLASAVVAAVTVLPVAINAEPRGSHVKVVNKSVSPVETTEGVFAPQSRSVSVGAPRECGENGRVVLATINGPGKFLAGTFLVNAAHSSTSVSIELDGQEMFVGYARSPTTPNPTGVQVLTGAGTPVYTIAMGLPYPLRYQNTLSVVQTLDSDFCPAEGFISGSVLIGK